MNAKVGLKSKSGHAPIIAVAGILLVIGVLVVGGLMVNAMMNNKTIQPDGRSPTDASGSFTFQAELYYDADRVPRYAVYAGIKNLQFGPPETELLGLPIPDLLSTGADANAYTIEMEMTHPDGSISKASSKVTERYDLWMVKFDNVLFFENGEYTVNIICHDQYDELVKENDFSFNLNDQGIEYLGDWTDWE